MTNRQRPPQQQQRQKQQLPSYELDLDRVATYGAIYAYSGYFGLRPSDDGGKEQAMVKIMFGHELGMSPAQSMLGIHIIENVPRVAAGTFARFFRESEVYDYRELTEPHERAERCEIEILRKQDNGRWKAIGSHEVTLAYAQERGWTKGKHGTKKNWEQHPDSMLFARCISACQRRFAPDLLPFRVYTGDELPGDYEVEVDAALVSARTVDVKPEISEQELMTKLDALVQAIRRDAHATYGDSSQTSHLKEDAYELHMKRDLKSLQILHENIRHYHAAMTAAIEARRGDLNGSADGTRGAESSDRGHEGTGNDEVHGGGADRAGGETEERGGLPERAAAPNAPGGGAVGSDPGLRGVPGSGAQQGEAVPPETGAAPQGRSVLEEALAMPVAELALLTLPDPKIQDPDYTDQVKLRRAIKDARKFMGTVAREEEPAPEPEPDYADRMAGDRREEPDEVAEAPEARAAVDCWVCGAHMVMGASDARKAEGLPCETCKSIGKICVRLTTEPLTDEFRERWRSPNAGEVWKARARVPKKRGGGYTKTEREVEVEIMDAEVMDDWTLAVIYDGEEFFMKKAKLISYQGEKVNS